MKIVTTRAELRAAHAWPGTLGLVPTMGFLHEGHLSLVERARAENEHVGVSIFVNPTQFGPNEDLASYPRDLDRDLALLREAGADLVWTPGVEDVYPPGFSTTVHVAGVTEPLEGTRRPGHFDGVATIVTILLNAFRADRAYFGQKDAQQAVVVRRMVADLAIGTEIVVAPTVREVDGLAKSSRNTYLEPGERAAATVLNRALLVADSHWRTGETDADKLRGAMLDVLSAEGRADVDYVSVADPVTLAELTRVDPSVGALASMAVRIGRTRLIDNVLLPPPAPGRESISYVR